MNRLKKNSLITFTILLLTYFTFMSVQAEETSKNKNSDLQTEFAPGQIIVKLKSENDSGLKEQFYSATEKELTLVPESLQKLHHKHSLKQIQRVFKKNFFAKQSDTTIEKLLKRQKRALYGSDSKVQSLQEELSCIYIFHFEPSVNIKNVLEDYNKDPNVEYAELNKVAKVNIVPNDPYYQSYGSWGQSFDDLYGLDKLQIEAAWDISQGSNIVIAVIDTGLDKNHEDISANIWTNSVEIPANGIDDDNNGYIDDLFGWNFIENNNSISDLNGHGTHCAGTIAAQGNNNTGIIGVAPQSKIMTVKALDTSGYGLYSDLAQAVIYAVDNGADILNNSWGGNGDSQIIKEAFDYAYANGCINIASAGNDNKDTGLYTPANLDTVIAVSASDNNDNKADFSNWGYSIDVSAPGVDILSLRATSTDMYSDGEHFVPPGNTNAKYYHSNGTSMASPHVSGIAALILALQPEYTIEEIRAVLRTTVDPVITEKYIGSGRVNAFKAVSLDYIPPTAKLLTKGKKSGTIDITGYASGDQFSHYSLYIGEGSEPASWTNLGTFSNPVEGGTLLSDLDLWIYKEGIHTLKLEVENIYGDINIDRTIIDIKNVELSFPLDNDILKPGSVLTIKGKIASGVVFTIEQGYGFNPTSWNKNGITLTGNNEGDIATWNTSNIIINGFYNLRVNAVTANGRKYILAAKTIYFDNNLKSGWPQYLLNNQNFIDNWQDVIVADIDQDGKSEILTFQAPSFKPPYNPAKFLVYNWDGSLRWSKEYALPEIDEYGNIVGSAVIIDIPTVADLDNNGDLEIIINAPLEGESINGLHAFSPNGEELPGWPVELQAKDNRACVADLDNDNNVEIIALSANAELSNDEFFYHLNIINANGTVQTTVPIPNDTQGTDRSQFFFPAIGNFDIDSDLEIVTRYGANQIAIYNYDGTLLPNWPVTLSFFSNLPIGHIGRSPVVGDINKDGNEEIIVVGTANPGQIQEWNSALFALDRYGKNLSGFPVLLSDVDLSTPALGDLDNNGDLEICLSGMSKVHVFHNNGNYANGWPQIPRNNANVPLAIARESCVIGDINGDNIPDIMVSGLGFNSKTMQTGDLSASGGLFAWKSNGVKLNLNPQAGVYCMFTEYSYWFQTAPPTLADIDSDGKLDIIASAINNMQFIDNNIKPKNRNSIYAWGLNTKYNIEKMQWPMFMNNIQHTGRFMDKTPPTIRLTSPANNSLASQSVQISGIASDNHGINRVEFYDNGNLFDTYNGPLSTNKFSINWDISIIPDGIHNITVKAFDAFDNCTSAEVSITTDSTGPDAILTPADGAYVIGKIPLVVDTSDPSGINRVEFYVDNVLKLKDTSIPYQYNWPTANLENKEYTITIYVYDKLLNSTKIESTLIVDNEVPKITITAPENAATIIDPVDITTTPSDNMGINKVVFSLDDKELATITEPPYNYHWIPDVFATGTHKITATAFDLAGNTSEDTVTINIPENLDILHGFSTNSEKTTDIAWGDSDNDGDLDILVGTNNLSPNVLYCNDGEGNFTITWQALEKDNTRGIEWGDYDQDGDLDQLIANVAGPNRVYQNVGNNIFNPVWSSEENNYTSQCCWGDIDNDGDLDIVEGNFSSQKNNVYLNNGNNQFVLVWSSEETDNTYDIALADFDNDGNIDILTGNWYGHNQIYRNLGNNQFVLEWIAQVAESTNAVACGDYDDDGDIDILVGNHISSSNTLGTPSRVYQNEGNLIFTPIWIAPYNDETYAVAWGDFDSDNDLDILVGNANQPIRLYQNNGNSVFNLIWDSPDKTNILTKKLAFGDYDNDGDLDILAGNYFSSPTYTTPNRIYHSNLVEKGIIP